MADYIVDTTPSSYTISPIVYNASTEIILERQESMVVEIRYVLTEFLRLLNKSNIPIENHRSVKTAYNTVWNAWLSMMKRYIRLGIWDAVLA
jgi:hypothetical protein